MSKMIELEEDFFEHLLNCLANQKYMRIPGEGQSAAETKDQEKIDKAWKEGMAILTRAAEKPFSHIAGGDIPTPKSQPRR